MSSSETIDRVHDSIINARIDACEARSYHRSARIQPHGLFLAVDPASLQIVRISANAGLILGVPNDILLSMTILTVLVSDSVAQIRDCANRLAVRQGNRTRLSVMLDIKAGRSFSAMAFVYRSGALLCIEIEPPGPASSFEDLAILSHRFLDMADDIARTNVTSSQLAGLVCKAIQNVTGFDRIYFCRFDRIGHGHVLGESNNGRLSSLMDHHFPATDIPQAARQIMMTNPFRVIPDVHALDVEIIGGDGAMLDLTSSTCRAIAGSHLQYLRNMDVDASLSFSVVTDDRLEALFGGHHHAAKTVSFRQMAACHHLVELYKARFDSLKMHEDRVVMEQSVRVQHDLAAHFLQSDCDLGTFVVANHDAFCGLMDADDVLCRFGEQAYLGRLLPDWQANELLDFLSRKIAAEAGVFRSDSLVAEDIEFRSLCPAVAGALAVSLDLSGSNIIAWLRPETVVDETWSGNPNQAVQVDETGSVGPRISFLAYVRETRGTSRAWSSTAGELAQQLRYTFSQALARYYESAMRKAAEQAAVLKSEFIANVSHELRSPMHAIIGFSEMLADDDGGMVQAKRERFLKTIIDSGRRLLHLIDDLLDLSRLHAGRMAFSFSVGEILPVIQRAIAGVDALARTKTIKITVQDDGYPHLVKLDSARMEQVIINLLSNALKFSPPQSCITVAVNSASSGGDPPVLIIEVSDQGVGIPPSELDLIFDKFIQSSRTKSGAGGTGLGLAISREIIQAHQGRIWAGSHSAGGASLFIELPQIPQHQNEITS